jgi:hypothetical protein
MFSMHLGKQAGCQWMTGDFGGNGATTFADQGSLQTNRSVVAQPPAEHYGATAYGDRLGSWAKMAAVGAAVL